MPIDVTDLKDFYDRPMGATVRRLLGHRIRARWRNVRGLSVLGLGYAPPYLGQFQGEALRIGALMPAAHGVRHWPTEGPGRTTLVDEEALPLADSSVDRLLLVHALEAATSARQTLREVWRVLAPEGRLIVVVPNRRGLWAQRDTTPFGHGEPYSRGQIERLLTGAMFAVEEITFALAMPPVELQLVRRSAPAWERLGARLWPAFSGVILVEARKQVGAMLPGTLAKARFRPAFARPSSARRSD